MKKLPLATLIEHLEAAQHEADEATLGSDETLIASTQHRAWQAERTLVDRMVDLGEKMVIHKHRVYELYGSLGRKYALRIFANVRTAEEIDAEQG